METKSIENGLVVQRLACRFPQFVLEADFHVGPDERVAIFSPSGTGKSTLLRILAGLDVQAPVTGDLRMDGRSVMADPPERRNVGVVFQEGLLFPQMNALENVAYPLKLRGVGAEERRRLALQWLEKLQLEKRAEHYPHELSGGERQRVAFARALVFRPRLILLDEAFSALDFRLRERVSTLLAEIHQEMHVPLLFVTHDMGERDRLATRVLNYSTDDAGQLHRFVD